MLLIIGILIACVGLASILNSSSRAYNEYCNMECQERKTKKFSICC